MTWEAEGAEARPPMSLKCECKDPSKSVYLTGR